MGDVLILLVLGGLMGLLGQGARTVIGLKGMADDAKALNLSPNDLFQAARLFTSLMIGFLVGLAAALAYVIAHGSVPDLAQNYQILVGFIAAGYTGTDFLEGFIAQYLPQGAAGTAVQKAKMAQLASSVQKPLAIPPAQAEKLVLKVFADRGQPGVNDKTKLSDIGYSNEINLYKLLASVNEEIIREYGTAHALGSSVLAKWSTVGDIVTSVEKA